MLQSFPLTGIDGIYYCAESLAAYAEYRDVAQAIANLQGQNDGEAKNGAIDMLEKNNLNAALIMVGLAIDNLIDAEQANPGLDLTECKMALSASAKAHAISTFVSTISPTSNYTCAICTINARRTIVCDLCLVYIR